MSVRTYLLIGLILLTTACNVNPLEVVVSRCPAIAVVGDTATLSAFKDGTTARRQEDLAYTATFSNVQIECENDDSINALIDFNVLARAYDAEVAKTITLPYFVAVLKDNSQLVTKQSYDITLTFDQNGLARGSQRVLAEVPTIEQARVHSYEVLIGFELDADKIYYNYVR